MEGESEDRLGQLAFELSSSEDLNEVLTIIARHTMEVLGYEDCVIYLVDPADPLYLEQRAAWGPKNPEGTFVQDPIKLRIGQGIVGNCAATKTAIVIDDTELDERHVSDTGSGRSELAVPIMFRGQTLGVIDSEHPAVGFYSIEDQHAVAAIAALASAQVRATRAIEQLADAANRDFLTGVSNRRSFDESLWAISADRRVHCIAWLDIDGFKQVNDLYGHHAGDQILRAVANQLTDVFGSDPQATIARLGGDEFGVISLRPMRHVRANLEKVIDGISEMTSRFGQVGVSAGIACGADNSVARRADDAMLIAKRLGGGRLVDHLSEPELVAELEQERSWRATIADMLSSQALELVFQEIRRLDGSGEPLVYEALLRAPQVSGGIGALISAAVQTGYDVEIDRWVLGRVLEVLQIHPNIAIAQNWSPRSFDRLGLTATLRSELEIRNIDPSRLIIEITEYASIDDPRKFAESVEELRSIGVRVALDDLGAGWTSFRIFDEVEIDVIKLDGAWVRQVHTNPVAREMVAATVRCARLLDVAVVAEWIEDEHDLAAIRALGVEYGQGYYLGSPRPLSDVLAAGRVLEADTSPEQKG